mmetsp:Transcript_89997/g.268490  ORF Transcript_89997/g.268490 Transcript_89997/m.268490 type:complete len:271 (+) Transcript_89997:209-1021(+)
MRHLQKCIRGLVRTEAVERRNALLWHTKWRPCRSSPGPQLHPEPVLRVDRGAGAGPHVLWVRGGRRELEGEVAEDHGQGDGPLHHGEDVSDALARSSSERNKGVVGGGLRGVEAALPLGGVITLPTWHLRVLVRPQEALGIVRVRIRPVLLAALHVVDRDEEVHPPEDLRLHAGGARRQRVLLQRAPDQQRRLGVHPQGLREAEAHELHGLYVLVRRVLLAPKDLVDLPLHLCQELCVLRQLEEGPRERGGRGLVAGNQHRDHVVAELLP